MPMMSDTGFLYFKTVLGFTTTTDSIKLTIFV